MSVFVSPMPVRRLPRLKLPRTANKLPITYRVKKKGA
jgi:hypothetical protein